MKHQEEVSRQVLSYLINRYPASAELNQTHWDLAYKTIRAYNIIETLKWKVQNLSVSL